MASLMSIAGASCASVCTSVHSHQKSAARNSHPPALLSLPQPLWRPSPVSATRHSARKQRSSARTLVVRAALPSERGGALTPEMKQALDEFISTHKVVLFMKGTKLFPQCGFSNTCIQILNELNPPYETVNVLENEQLRAGLKEYSSWQTFPQLYVDGEFVGGCDITIEMFQSGELKEVIDKALLS